MKVFNLSGQMMYSDQIGMRGSYAHKYSLRLSTGAYFITLEGEGVHETVKMIVQ